MSAILASFELLKILSLPYRKIPVCIITDNEICFNNYFGYNPNVTFPVMTRNMKRFVKGNRCLLIKIPSHEDKFGRPTILSNDIADRLALEGRLLSKRLMLRTVPHNQMTHSCLFYRTLQDTIVDPLRCALAPTAPVLRSTSEGRAARDQSPEGPFRSAPLTRPALRAGSLAMNHIDRLLNHLETILRLLSQIIH